MKTDGKYWFPAKTFGWGWGLPRTWQGWVVFLVYLLVASAGKQDGRFSDLDLELDECAGVRLQENR